MTMRFRFEKRKTVTTSGSGSEYDDAEYAENVYSASIVNTEVPGPYDTMRRFADHAGAVTTGSSMFNTPWYKERLPDSAPFNTHLVAVETSDRVATVLPGFWALITDVEDVSTETLAFNYLDITFWVLAELDEYSTHNDVEADFKK